MWAIVKFSDQNRPVMFDLDNSGFSERLLTMDNVVWIQVITSSGHVHVAEGTKLAVSEFVAPMRPKVKEEVRTVYKLPNAEELPSVMACIRNYQKVRAIKAYREAVEGCGLLTAKNEVEAAMFRKGYDA
jgi:ribosomal protein L7/L12